VSGVAADFIEKRQHPFYLHSRPAPVQAGPKY
jgi:hypothetical protein